MGHKKILIIEDDSFSVEFESQLLKTLGWKVYVSESSMVAYDEVLRIKPDIILLDLMLPGLDGFEVCKQIRSNPDLAGIHIVVVSAKAYDADQNRAYQAGADGYIVKPFTQQKFEETIQSFTHMRLTFWGVRGTVPVPGPTTTRYGGNTSCVSLELPRNLFFIFDGGTGIRGLSKYLFQAQRKRIKANIMISHPHWDHINAFPFFAQLYIQGNDITFYGPNQGGDYTIRKLISDQMDGIYFPVTIKEFGASVDFVDLSENTYQIDGVEMKTITLVHPGKCLGYRLNYNGLSVCYITDNELYPKDTPFFHERIRNQLISFISGADILIHDTTYFDQAYPGHIHWGHSSVTEVANLACAAQVKNLYLFHHDPEHTDDDLDRKLEVAQAVIKAQGLKINVLLPVENKPILLHY